MKSGFFGMGISSTDDKERIHSHFMNGRGEAISESPSRRGDLRIARPCADNEERISRDGHFIDG